VTYDEAFAGSGEVVAVPGDELVRADRVLRCGVCGAATRWWSVCAEGLPVCSDACLREFWVEFDLANAFVGSPEWAKAGGGP